MPSEGYITNNGYQTWYSVHGNIAAPNPPLLVLHGGPGYTHYHLENLAKLAGNDQAIILYDQLGCGKSDRPDDPKLWTIQLFIDEIAALRNALHLEEIYLLGHSWGGSLAVEYMLTKPVGVRKLILSSPLLDSQMWVDEANTLIDKLPNWAAMVMRKHQAADSTDTYEYEQAYAEYKLRFICRIRPYPLSLTKADNEAGMAVYATMWGPSETCITGTLMGWSVMDRLPEINIPTLFLSGKYDEASPGQVAAAHRRIRGSAWHMFEHSSHSANLEEPEKYLEVVDEFLRHSNQK